MSTSAGRSSSVPRKMAAGETVDLGERSHQQTATTSRAKVPGLQLAQTRPPEPVQRGKREGRLRTASVEFAAAGSRSGPWHRRRSSAVMQITTHGEPDGRFHVGWISVTPGIPVRKLSRGTPAPKAQDGARRVGALYPPTPTASAFAAARPKSGLGCLDGGINSPWSPAPSRPGRRLRMRHSQRHRDIPACRRYMCGDEMRATPPCDLRGGDIANCVIELFTYKHPRSKLR